MADIQEKTARVEGSHGTSLFYRQYTPVEERFWVVISHGLREYSGRYGQVVDTLCHYKDLYHEIYNEKPLDRESVLEDMRRWVAARFP